jgi:tryptophan halogenase
MSESVKNIVIVGGGAAGWLTAGLIAARYYKSQRGIGVTVIESPDIPTVGVGEGTWPSMRTTLRRMGISEMDFIRTCSASFKQGSKFCRWRKNDPSDFYYHPFDMPDGMEQRNVAEYWLSNPGDRSFSETVCAQERLCEQHLAPKIPTSPDFAGLSNYGYHLDAGAFSEFLKKHCTSNLYVTLIADNMTSVIAAENGDIRAVETQNSGAVEGDLFIDCTGFRALLLGGHFGVPLKSKSDVLFQDTALAVQVPYGEHDPVQSPTVSTAQPAGWIWDVSLSSRRGIGHVYSSNHMNEEQATECVRKYLGLDEKAFGKYSVRKLSIGSGYRETFWKQNCVAVGLSAGFLEPLEASALMLIENCATMIAEEMPATRGEMDTVSTGFNERLHAMWGHIIHFLKLHYCLSERQEPFWRDNRSASTIPEALSADLKLWREHVPGLQDSDTTFDVFPSASYQYVLYGMGYKPVETPRVADDLRQFSQQKFAGVMKSADQLGAMLSTNRTFLNAING